MNQYFHYKSKSINNKKNNKNIHYIYPLHSNQKPPILFKMRAISKIDCTSRAIV